MFKKVLYTLVIVSMLVAAFGVQGMGVRTASATTPPWYDGLPADANLPIYDPVINMPGADFDNAGNQGGCSAVAVFGNYQGHLLDDVAAGTPAGFYRVRVEASDTGSYQWAVMVRNAATNVEIACAVAVGGIVDLTVPVGVGVDVVVTIANIGFFVPTDPSYEAYVARNVHGGGLIVDMRADAGDRLSRDVDATNVSSGENFNGWFDTAGANVLFVDAPDGDYNLGITDTDVVAFAAYYPGETVPGIIAPTPDNDAVIPLTIDAKDETGADLAFSSVFITPNDGGLNTDLYLGATNATGDFTFFVNPGYLWDVAVIDYGATDYILVELAINPTLGPLVFDLSVNPPAWVSTCIDDDYDARSIEIELPGALHGLTHLYVGVFNLCGPGHNSVEHFITPGLDYEATVTLFESGWDYVFAQVTWNHAANITAPGYQTIYGDTPFLTTPLPNATSQELYTLPLAAGEVILERGPWTDQDGNMLTSVLDDTGVTPVDIAPEYWLESVSGGLLFPMLANDWATTDLGPVTDVGRYQYERALQYGPNLTVPAAPGGFFDYVDLFAIQPADMSMMTDWSWSWVMAMYEYDLTNGLNGGGYTPNAPVTRAQMAAFLARTLDLFGLAPTGAAPAFSDVPAAYWASAEIAFLRDYGITTGTDWCNGVAVVNSFCPNANVTRAEMAKFIEVTFRTIKVFGGVDFYWIEEQNIYTHGITFMDVPVDYWANIWVEEFFFDQLTDGCMRDGLNLYFCPGDDVTRGQMAKFIIRAIQPDFATQGFWPILAPSK